MKLSELMTNYTPNADYEGWVTNDDYVFAINLTPETANTAVTDFAVVEMGIAGLDAQLNPITQDKTYIRAGQNTRIKDSIIGNGTSIQSSVILESKVGNETSVGPFAYLRPNSEVGSHCKVGDFVEIKNSRLDDGAKAAHLTYVGDSDVGKKVNLGCGVVFVNYDGSKKYRSVVEDGAFIGCNVNLVSPVHVGKDAYVAAGSTITNDVEDGALYVARSKGRSIEGWVEKRGILKK